MPLFYCLRLYTDNNGDSADTFPAGNEPFLWGGKPRLSTGVHLPDNLYHMAFLSPDVSWRERTWLKEEWHINKGTILVVGFLVLFTYLMVLFALQMSKGSYVVAVREVSIAFSACYGALRLGEKHARQRFVDAVSIALAVVLIGLSG